MNAEQLQAAIAELEAKADGFSEQRSTAEKEARRLKKRAEEYRKDLLQLLTSSGPKPSQVGKKQ